LNYYWEEEIVYIFKTLFHRPLVPRRRDSFEARREQREGVFSGESVRGRFSRSPRPTAIDMPERLRSFDLPRVLLGTNQKRFPLCDLGVSAVNVINFMLSLIDVRSENEVEVPGRGGTSGCQPNQQHRRWEK
jgi:hypothetical protein